MKQLFSEARLNLVDSLHILDLQTDPEFHHFTSLVVLFSKLFSLLASSTDLLLESITLNFMLLILVSDHTQHLRNIISSKQHLTSVFCHVVFKENFNAKLQWNLRDKLKPSIFRDHRKFEVSNLLDASNVGIQSLMPESQLVEVSEDQVKNLVKMCICKLLFVGSVINVQ